MKPFTILIRSQNGAAPSFIETTLRHKKSCFIDSHSQFCFSNFGTTDYFLFLKLKGHLQGIYSSNNEEVMTAVNKWLAEQQTEFVCRGIQVYYSTDTDLSGGYAEK